MSKYYSIAVSGGIYEFRPGKHGLEVWFVGGFQNTRSMIIPWLAIQPPPKTKAELAEECVEAVLEYRESFANPDDPDLHHPEKYPWVRATAKALEWKDAPE